MAAANFRPIYKTDWSSQGKLVNDTLPTQLEEIFASIKLLENRNKESIEHAIAWLATFIPLFKKFFTNYDTLKEKLEECRILRDNWIRDNNRNGFPIKLKDGIFELYEDFLTAYNDSGAGIKGSIYIPRDTRIKEGVQRI